MADETLPQSKAELMSLIEREWSALMNVVKQLSPEQMVTPDEGGWSPKENLAHLTAWMDILIGYYIDRRPSHEVVGVAPEVTENWDYEAMNAVLFERHRHLAVSYVLYELEKTYAYVLSRLEAMSFEDLMKPRFEDDPKKQLLLLWVIGNTSDHFAEHRETIERKLNK
jgi:hypothetical protein